MTYASRAAATRNQSALPRTPELVRRALYERGITLRQWAHEHDYNYSAVQNAVKRHAGGHAREPWGQTTRAIRKG